MGKNIAGTRGSMDKTQFAQYKIQCYATALLQLCVTRVRLRPRHDINIIMIML